MNILNTNDELKRWLGISLAIHILAVFIIAAVSSRHRINRTFYAPVYKVDLVTLEKPKPAKKKTAKARIAKKVVTKPETKKKAAKISKRRSTSKAAVKKAPKPVKNIPVDPSASINAIREKYAAAKAVERLKEELGTEREPEPKDVAENEARTATPSSLPKQGAKKVSIEDMDMVLRGYYDLLWEKIRKSWVLPGSGDFSGMEAIISVRFTGAGELLDVSTEEGSGNGFYDQSAIRAIRKSAPFPPLPNGYEGGMEIGFRFRPDS